MSEMSTIDWVYTIGSLIVAYMAIVIPYYVELFIKKVDRWINR